MSKDLRRGLRERDKRIKNNLLKDMKKAVYPKGDFYLTSEGERLIPYYRKRNIALNKHLDNLKDKPVKVEGWEKDFRTRIINKEFGDYWHIDYPKLKSFIRQLLKEQKEEIVEKIEKIGRWYKTGTKKSGKYNKGKTLHILDIDWNKLVKSIKGGEKYG